MPAVELGGPGDALGRTLSISVFDNSNDNVPAHGDATWAQLVEGLREPRVAACTTSDRCWEVKLDADGNVVGDGCPHKNGPAWSPVTYAAGAKRARSNVESVHALVLDVDHVKSEGELRGIVDRVQAWKHIVHASHSDRIGDRCLRVVLAISRPVTVDEFARVRSVAMEILKLPADKRAADASRLFYLPSRPADACDPSKLDGTGYLFGHGEEKVLDVDAILAMAEPEVEFTQSTFSPPAFAGAPPADKVEAAARAIADALRARGDDRHAAHLRLAGALAWGGWPVDDITSFLVRVAEFDQPGNPKHVNLAAGCARSSHEKVQRGENVQGWPKLGEIIGEVAVRAAKDALGMATNKLSETEASLFSNLIASASAPASPPATSGSSTGASVEVRGDGEIACLLKRTKEGIRPCGSNVELILRHSHDLAGRIRWNEIERAIELTGGRFTDEDANTLDVALKNWLEDHWNLFVSTQQVGEQLLRVARRFGSYDPVHEYLTGLAWDGVARIDGWLTTYCHVPASDYIRKIGARWLISGAARGLDPGCKVDTVLILQGPQGYRKSMTFDVLGGEWFSDSPLDLTNKDARISAASTWIIELAELAALGQKGLESHKAFLSARNDKVRPPYGRVEVRFKRHGIFGGTTNDDEFLIDATGNRRYWIARVRQRIDVESLRRDRDQLWAEAVVRYRAAERWWFDEDEQIVADAVTEQHRPESPEVDKIRAWYESQATRPNEDGAPPGAFKLAEVMDQVFHIQLIDVNKHKSRIARLLGEAGFASEEFGARKNRRWVPKVRAVRAVSSGVQNHTTRRNRNDIEVTGGGAVGAVSAAL